MCIVYLEGGLLTVFGEEGRKVMAIEKAYHTKKETNVYHLFHDCYLGNNIESENKRWGTGSKRLCSKCRKRKSKGKR